VHNLEPVVNIHQYCWSIRRSRLVAGYIKVDNGLYLPSDAGERSMPSVRETSYRRVVGWPHISWITSSGLSPTEVSLGAALAFARKPRYKRLRGR
jgi:hypothetical protein